MARRAVTSLLSLLSFVAGLALSAPSLPAQDATSANAGHLASGEQLDALLGKLDSPHYDVRRTAARELETLVEQKELGSVLARRFRRELRRPGTSFEVRWHLERWLKLLPETPVAPLEEADAPDAEQLDRLVVGLLAEDYAARAAARERLEWLLANGEMVGPISRAVKAAFDRPGMSWEDRLALERACDELRRVWAGTDPDRWDLPPVDWRQVDRWIRTLATVEAQAATKPARMEAERELRDLMMRDPCVPRLRQLLSTRLETVEPGNARATLADMLRACQPGMVAEFWEDRHHKGEQHLLVGEPSQTPNAPRPSHFDRIDDHTAHCVSGSSLGPGDYPVGVAFPHPRALDAFFRLVNLPSPRRRLAYQRELERDEAHRLRRISRATLDRWLDRGTRLDPTELNILPLLDPDEVSRFAGRILTSVDDMPTPEARRRPDPYHPGGTLPEPQFVLFGQRLSHHGVICLQLALEGTRAAIPGLLKALEDDRLSDSGAAGYRLDRIAALRIAQRDPWPTVDRWLAAAVEQGGRLAPRSTAPSTLQATAAAILLRRAGHPLDEFGLEITEADSPLLKQLGLRGYRFRDEDAAERVIRWWREHRDDRST